MLVSTKHKKLVLRLRDPERVLSVIPKAKLFGANGREYIAVHHGVDEVAVLNNLGIDAPSPILYYYDWPGRFAPYEHQKETAAFLTKHNRSFCLNGMGCIAGDERVRVSRKSKSMEITLRDLFKKFHSLQDKDSWKVRSLLGDRFGMNKLEDVVYKGEQQVLRITLECGKVFKCTPDHEIAQPGGNWSAAGDLSVGDLLITNGSDRLEVPCPVCGASRSVSKYDRQRAAKRVCRSCKHKAQGAELSGDHNPRWKGGKPFVDKDGYVRVYMPGHHRADKHGRVYEHIVVAEAAYSRVITTSDHVHHKNGIKCDNRPENLEVLPARDHCRIHDPVFKLDGAISGKGGVVVVKPRYSKVVSIEPAGVTDVYDLCMAAPYHNFVVNGVVVHNSGKTLSLLWTYDYLRSVGAVKKMLVVTSLSTLERTWADEIFEHFPHLDFVVLHGSRGKRFKLLGTGADVYLINHDGVKVSGFVEEMAKRPDIDMIVVDEVAQAARNAGTDRFRALTTIINRQVPRRAIGLTGTPTPNAPTDAWAQCRLIVPERVPPYFNRFRDQVMRQVSTYTWVPRDDAQDVVQDAMQPAIRYSLEECIDLPECIYETRQAELTKQQASAYKDMFNRLCIEMEQGGITAANEAVKAQKLIQVACGCVYDDSGNEIQLDAGPRMNVLIEVIEQAGSKVIIFVPFRSTVTKVMEGVKAAGFTAMAIHGGVSKAVRDIVLSDFQKEKNPHVLVAQPGTMSHGLNLTAANTIVWYAPIFSNDIFGQANARVRRPGQKYPQLVVMIEGTPIERKYYARLKEKEKIQGLLLDAIQESRVSA